MHDSRVMWFYSVFWCNSNKITSMCLFLCIYSNKSFQIMYKPTYEFWYINPKTLLNFSDVGQVPFEKLFFTNNNSSRSETSCPRKIHQSDVPRACSNLFNNNCFYTNNFILKCKIFVATLKLTHEYKKNRSN